MSVTDQSAALAAANAGVAIQRHAPQDSGALDDAPTADGAHRLRVKRISALVMLALSAMLVLAEYPRMVEPQPWPALGVAAIEADLDALVTQIEAYRVNHGLYPAGLDVLRLPAGLGARVNATRLEYRLRATGYTLDWKLPAWRAFFDSHSLATSVVPAGKP